MARDIFSIKVLVVEDFATTRKIQIHSLKKMGFSDIVEADDGETAIRKIVEEGDIGLIISDWNMPKISGFDLLLWVRSEEKYADILFVMATAQGEKKQSIKALEAGANAFITKPFTPDELKKVILNVCGEKEEQSTPASIPEPIQKSSSGKVRINVSHIQITDHLVLGVLKYLIGTEKLCPKYFELNTMCMSSWNPVRDSLEKGEADAAFILAPLAMDIFNDGVPIRLVLLSHKNGSICVRNLQSGRDQGLHDFLKSKTFYLPHTISIHHLLADMFLREIGLTLGPVGKEGADVFFEVVPPARMPEFLLNNPNSCGFVVAEPFGTKAINEGISDLMFFSGELWENHPCCVVAFRDEFIDAHSDAVYEFVEMLVQAGQFIEQEPKAAARLAYEFLDPNKVMNLSVPIFESVLTQPAGIRTGDLFPVIEDLDKIQRYMAEKMGIGNIVDLEKFVDIRFAEAACRNLPPIRSDSKIQRAAHIIANVINRNIFRHIQVESDQPHIFDVRETEDRIVFQISSDMKLAERVIRRSQDFLKKLDIGSFSDFNLILRELLSNAVEHGNQNMPDKQIQCSVRRIQDTLFEITVSDEGQGFDYRKLDMTMPKVTEKLRKRGYPFIHKLSEKLEFNDKGNEIKVYYKAEQEIRFDTREEDGWMIVRPSGNITAAETQNFQQMLRKLAGEGYSQYCFDLSDVRYIDSAGLGAFDVFSRLLIQRRASAKLKIIHADSELVGIFHTSQLDKSYYIEEG